MTIAITGATGFIGHALCQHLINKPHWQELGVRALCRSAATNSAPGSQGIDEACLKQTSSKVAGVDCRYLSSPWNDEDLTHALKGCQTLVHLAGRAHQQASSIAEEEALQHSAHVELSQQLARAAQTAKIKRIVYISTAKVLGESSGGGIFTHNSPAAPEDPYSKAKWASEQWLQEFCQEAKIELVILRPGLVYDLNARGNLALLKKCLDYYIPLPLYWVRNRRDMVALENFVELIETCLEHPSAAGEVFLAADGQAISTPQLIRLMATAQDKPALLWPLPMAILNGLALLTGRTQQLEKVCGNFAIDISHSCEKLQWQPSVQACDVFRPNTLNTGSNKQRQPTREP